MKRSAVAALAIVAAALLGAAPAIAAGSPRIDRQGWSKTGALGPLSPQAGNVYVSAAAGQEQARSFLHIDPAGADEATIAGATVTLAESTDGVVPDQAALLACALTASFEGSGQVTGDAPTVDCTLAVAPTRAADGAWSLPLGVFAHVLAGGISPGVAILPNVESGTATFTVSFDTARTRVDTPVVAAPAPIAPAPAANPETAPAQSGSVTFDTALPPSAGPSPQAPPAAVAAAPQPSSVAKPVAPRSPLPAPAKRAFWPPAVLVLVPMALAAAVLWARGRWLPPVLLPDAAVPTAGAAAAGAWLVGIAFALLASEVTTYKLGLIAIVFIGAIGLHILVNWAGELSLAHAAFIGLPAFAAAQLSTHSGVSPILALPLGVVVGAVLGLVVAIPALRARGLQVALVTLAVGIAVDRFFFVRSWVIGSSGGLRVPVPSLLGIRFETSRSLLPVLVVILLIAVLACRAILDSKIGRALSLVRANPDAAAAVGIPVAYYRSLVYMIAGGFAGLAGSSYVLWVQRISPKAFPLDLGFTYLVIAVLAGKGGLGGLGLSAILLEGGALFSILPQSLALYLGPIALIFNVTRYQEGFNGVLREMRQRFSERGAGMTEKEKGRGIRGTAIRLPVVVASVVIVAGFAALVLAWYHAGNTDQLWVQNQEIVSGGLGGLSLIVLGSMLLVRDALIHGAGVVAGRGREPDAG